MVDVPDFSIGHAVEGPLLVAGNVDVGEHTHAAASGVDDWQASEVGEVREHLAQRGIRRGGYHLGRTGRKERVLGRGYCSQMSFGQSITWPLHSKRAHDHQHGV